MNRLINVIKIFRNIFQLYTCEENEVANEYDFKKALDLLDFVEQEEEKASLKLRIWARVARRDKWDIVTKNPEQQVQDTMFFKLMDLTHFMGRKLNNILFLTIISNLYLPFVFVFLSTSILNSFSFFSFILYFP